jgi:hypothetical protein
MAVQASPTRNGGFVVIGDTDWGRFHVEWDQSGQLVADHLDRRDPSTNAPKGIGSHLIDIIANRWGAIPCGDCKRAARQLNELTPDAANAKRAEIIGDIYSRLSQLPKWWQRWGARLAPGIAKQRIGDMLDEAIKRSQENGTKHA